MPFVSQEVEAEILLEYRGYTVYRQYDGKELERPLPYIYAFEQDVTTDMFDVRKLENFPKEESGDSHTGALYKTAHFHATIVREAIDRGYLNRYISAAGLETPDLQNWAEKFHQLDRWQMLEVIRDFDAYAETTRVQGHELYLYTVSEYYEQMYRPMKMVRSRRISEPELVLIDVPQKQLPEEPEPAPAGELHTVPEELPLRRSLTKPQRRFLF